MSDKGSTLIHGTGPDGSPVPLVRRYELGIDAERLHRETRDLVVKHPLIFEGTKQLAVQMRKGSTDPWYESCYQESEIAPEHEYDTLIPELEGTYFEEVMHSLPFPVVRARVLGLEARRCYSVHQDETARYHIALDTSEHALFVFVEQNEVFRVPMDGNLYWLDTRQVHTAMNGGRDLRLHLVVGAVG